MRLAMLAVAMVALWWFRGVLLLGFASILIAVALHTLAQLLARRTRLPQRAALAIIVALVLAFVGATLALFGWRIADQFDEILARAQASLGQLMAFAREHNWSSRLLSRLTDAPIEGATAGIAPALADTLGAVGEVAALSAIVVASGIFLAIQPARHLEGALLLFPRRHRRQARAFVTRAGEVLRKWLVSRLIVMIAIGVLSSMGLWLLNIPGALALGLTGGLLTFIPLVGALIAAVPAILVGLAQSPLQAIYVALMYWAVHFIEGTFITPYVQDEEVDLPPVLTMYSALIAAALFGAAGVFLSSPLALMVIVALKTFYLDPRDRVAEGRPETAASEPVRAAAHSRPRRPRRGP